MCGSNLSVKGGMVSVIKNYLEYNDWNKIIIKFIPTYIESNKVIISLYFIMAYIEVFFSLLFGKYDVLYVHAAERGSFYRKSLLIELAHSMGVKTVIHHHAAEFEEFYTKSNKKEYIVKILELVDLNIVLSNRLVTMITDKSPNANVKVLYNAVNTYSVNPYNLQANNILFLGRLGKRKGVYDLLKAIKKNDNQLDSSIKFYLCGNGEIEEVRHKVKELKIENRIAHIGWIDGKQKDEFLENTMINVLPSYNEGLPMTILETMAYGIPNISTNIASIPEVIEDGVDGYLIEPGDVTKLSKILLSLTKDKNKLIQMSKLNYEIIMNTFSLDKNTKLLEEMIEDLFE